MTIQRQAKIEAIAGCYLENLWVDAEKAEAIVRRFAPYMGCDSAAIEAGIAKGKAIAAAEGATNGNPHRARHRDIQRESGIEADPTEDYSISQHPPRRCECGAITYWNVCAGCYACPVGIGHRPAPEVAS